MPLIDTHTHLESFARAGQLPVILERAQAAGVGKLVTIGTSDDDWELYRQMASERPGVIEFTVGLHPCAVEDGWEKQVAQMPSFWEARAVGATPVALGECGLDRFHLPKEPAASEHCFARQREAFAAQLHLAKQLHCPLVVHSRGAFHECVAMIDASGVDWRRVVFHCFTEGEVEMRQLMERGGFGSFTGVLTYKSAENVRAAAQVQGIERLMLETDAPYLTPMPHRGKPNEPAYLRHTAEFAAELFGVGVEELTKSSSASAAAFFNLRDRA